MILLSLGLLSELNKKQVSILAGLLQCLNIPPEGTKSLHGCSLLPALGASMFSPVISDSGRPESKQVFFAPLNQGIEKSSDLLPEK